jgi:hypothetical protein
MGKDDNSSVEFNDYATVKRTDSLAVPTDWSTRTNWKIISKGLKLDRNGALKLTYNLSSVPAYGVELSFRILDAFQSTPQMAVFLQQHHERPHPDCGPQRQRAHV